MLPSLPHRSTSFPLHHVREFLLRLDSLARCPLPTVSSADSNDSIMTPDPEMIEMVSPFSSRCASPLPSAASLQYRAQQHSALPLRNLSISSLTNRLTIHPSSSPTTYSAYSSSSEEDHDFDEACFTEEPHPLEQIPSSTSSYYSDYPVTPTSAPSYYHIRRSRQALSRLQCSATNALHLAMLIEEQHPSSFPLPPLEATAAADVSPERRRVSVASISSKRKVKKSGSGSRKASIISVKSESPVSASGGNAVVKRGSRMRKGTGGSASGAGRR